MAELKTWLGVGGMSPLGFGKVGIEARVSMGGETWAWLPISCDKLRAYMNDHPEVRDSLLETSKD